MKIITGEDDRLGLWLCARQEGAKWFPGGRSCIGIENELGELQAVAMFEEYNKANLTMHIAAVSGRHWLNREFLWYCFYYPFVELNCKRVTGLVASTNLQARKFDENLGFTLEATLKDAHPDGDLLVYVMTKENCRWLTLKERQYGKKRPTPSTRLCGSGETTGS